MIDLVRTGVGLYLLYAGFIGVNNYETLRWVVFLSVLFLTLILWYGERVNNGIKSFYLIFFIILIALFNPISPVYLYDRSIWMLIDIVAGILIIIKPIVINSLMDKDSEEYQNHFGRKNR